MIAMVFLGVVALPLLWFTDAADTACGAIVLAAVTYGCFDKYESELGLWMLSPLFGFIFILTAVPYLLPPKIIVVEQHYGGPLFAYLDWFVGVIIGLHTVAWLAVAVVKNLDYTSLIRGTKSPVIIDRKDLREP